ncbi:uncharacterized protein LOC126675472 isoform X2 [Mercurialis annua]|uniref:uncharacterized protein LOC126675472 isoform X2 n=1 Tax=Mercurialis annua TaxID=3986 RepID=UPI00215FA185|nr:uncharacterized protein LOC126675472 isoform X2 [Mercurialis annua]
MNLLKLNSHVFHSHNFHFSHFHSIPHEFKFPFKPFTPLPLPSTPTFKVSSFSKAEPSFFDNKEQLQDGYASGKEFEYLAQDGAVYQNTLRLVECSMFAAVSGLVYFLSVSLSIENYFGCFFSLPIVISSLRWGVAGGRKTMVATAMLLFVLSGPLKALTYLLTHGVVGFTMGSLWRLKADWGLSILACTIARASGAMGLR